MKPERRTLEEVATLYKLENTIRDLYVEGDRDQSLIDWFLAERGVKAVSVISINYVDIPAKLALKKGLEDNNRGRVLVLADFLENELGKGFLRVSCIADSDFDLVYNRSQNCPLLLPTDYASMEMYCFNPKTLTKFLKVGLGGFPMTGADVISALTTALQQLFTIRMAHQKLGWGMRPVGFERSCTLKQGDVHLDSQDYIARYLNKNDRAADASTFQDAVNECRTHLRSEPRFQIHGHDLVDALTWYVKQHASFGNTRRDTVEKALFASLESGMLAEQGLFRRLIERLRSS